MREGADFVATGHYARIKKEDDVFKMLAGKDKNKDQSYFLWTLGQKQLSKTIFPVGDLEKSEVRRLAKKFKLPNAERKDSQGLCFVGPVDVKDFLAQYAPQKNGDVLDVKGKVIGNHPGALFFTIGERHGFRVTKKTPNDEPYFVVAKDMKKNTITVGHKKDSLSGMKKEFNLESVNWISGAPITGKKYTARVRHLGAPRVVRFRFRQNYIHRTRSSWHPVNRSSCTTATICTWRRNNQIIDFSLFIVLQCNLLLSVNNKQKSDKGFMQTTTRDNRDDETLVHGREYTDRSRG